MKRRTVCKPALVVLFSLCWLNAVLAAEWKSDQYHFSVELPAGWNELDPPRNEVKVVARKPDDMWTVMAVILPSGGAEKLTPKFVAGFKRGYEAKGGHIESERFFTHNGRPSCELDARMTQQGVAIRQQIRLTIVDKRLYQLIAVGLADGELDAAVVPFFNSFRVSAKSESPVAASGPRTLISAAHEEPAVASDLQPADQIAYLAGRIVGFLIGLSLVAGVLVVFIVFIVKMASGTRTPPVRPPNVS